MIPTALGTYTPRFGPTRPAAINHLPPISTSTRLLANMFALRPDMYVRFQRCSPKNEKRGSASDATVEQTSAYVLTNMFAEISGVLSLRQVARSFILRLRLTGDEATGDEAVSASAARTHFPAPEN